MWEYKIEPLRSLYSEEDVSTTIELIDRVRTVNDLNQFDEEGWEFVTVVPASQEWLAFLRRAKHSV